jgi:hypothetical protein
MHRVERNSLSLHTTSSQDSHRSGLNSRLRGFNKNNGAKLDPNKNFVEADARISLDDIRSGSVHRYTEF